MPYTAAIVGLGFIGGADQVSGDALGQQVDRLDGTHLHALDGHSGVDLVCGSSRDPGRRERFEARTGLPTFERWRDLIDAHPVDILSVATYTPAHAEITIAAAEAGVRAIYCEKPLAGTLAGAQSMLDACRDAGALLAVNHNMRFNANARRLRDHVAAGGLGDLTSCGLQWGAGRLGNVGTHMIDALIMMTGRQPEAVSATLDLSGKPDCRGPAFVDPGGWGTIRLEGDLMATVDAADYATCPPTLTLNGTEAAARFTFGPNRVDIAHRDGPTETWPPETDRTGMDIAVAEIVDHLDGARPFEYDPVGARDTLETILAFHASHARRSATVTLPLTGADRDIVLHSG